MKQVIIRIPEGVELVNLHYGCGHIVQIFDNKGDYRPTRGELVRVYKNGKYKGLAVIDNYSDMSFLAFTTKNRVYGNSRFYHKMEFRKAEISDITKFFAIISEHNFYYDPVMIAFAKKK